MKKHTKKSVIWLIIMSMLLFTMQAITLIAAPIQITLNIGDYINYGSYGGNDILWRVVAQDEKGTLLWQDSILEYKAYDKDNENIYEDSDIRGYLNNEKGFLGCFSGREKNLMKGVGEGLDKMFIPRLEELGAIRNNGKQLGEDYYYRNKGGSYWLASPYQREREGKLQKVSIVSSRGEVVGEAATSISVGILPAFYLDLEPVVFKAGEGSRNHPYILYTEWQEVPQLKANGDQVILSNVSLIGEENQFMLMPIIAVDGSPYNVKAIRYDAEHKRMIYSLEVPIKQNQIVSFRYDLPYGATSAIAKVGEREVLKQIAIASIANETVDPILQPIMITQPLKDEEIKVGDNRVLTVTAKGEGALTFNWFKINNGRPGENINNGPIKTEIKLSYNKEVSSSYLIQGATLADAGNYRVEVSGIAPMQSTACEVKVIENTYRVTKNANPIKGGSTGDNSLLGDGKYTENTMATVTAMPNHNYRFINWTENGKEVSRDRNYTFKVTEDRNLLARFKWDEPTYIPQYTIYVTKNPSEGGTVTGDYIYNEGEYVTLKARPKDEYVFESWTENGIVMSRESEYSFTARKNRWLKANFEKEVPQEKTFKEEWRSLSARQTASIKENFKEYLPYTTLDESLSVESLDKLTKGYFTKKQLREVNRNLKLLEDRGVPFDWELIKLKKVSQGTFKDLSRSHWAYSNIVELAKGGIVAGYPDQTFKPSQSLTVADTFTFLDRMLLTKDITEVRLPRSTVERYIQNKNSWAFHHVASIGTKLTKDTLRTIGNMGNDYLSRELLAQVLYEVTEGNLSKTKPLVGFTDTLYSPYEKAIDYCIRTGLLEGTSSYTMSPKKPVTRAEMMTILQRIDNLVN